MNQSLPRPTVLTGRNFPLNCWYVAARSNEVAHALTARRVADLPVLLVRQDDGSVAALEDRSPHRPYPLSLGRLEGDEIISGLDGWVFDLTGECVRVPSQTLVPLDARVRRFPVLDDGTFVFVWPGNPAVAALRPPPRSSWDNPDWTAVGGQLDVSANYLLLHEMFADVTHVPFVHADVAPPVLASAVPPAFEVEVSETSVSFNRNYPAAALAGWHSAAVGLPAEGKYPQSEHGTFVSPGLWVDRWEVLHDGEPLVLGFTQAITPVSAGSTRLFWWISRNATRGDTAVNESLRAAFTEYYAQVARVAETMQQVIDTDGTRNDVNVSADTAALRVRAIVSTLVREESVQGTPRRRSRRTANL
jgi:phenylpropionate dioxygenase-like ring-hydroxylating dioxygenase large terminal subunit